MYGSNLSSEKSREFKGGVWSPIRIEPAVIMLCVSSCGYAVRE